MVTNHFFQNFHFFHFSKVPSHFKIGHLFLSIFYFWKRDRKLKKLIISLNMKYNVLLVLFKENTHAQSWAFSQIESSFI